MRKHLAHDFNRIYVIDLKGNIRKDSMRDGIPLGEKHTVFGLAAMVGISIICGIRNPGYQDNKIFYTSVDWRATRIDKFNFLEAAQSVNNLQWTEILPDEKNNWLTEGLIEEFETFLPLGTREAKRSKSTNVKTIFKQYSLGVVTNRDAHAYAFNPIKLAEQAKVFTDIYNGVVDKFKRLGGDALNLIDYSDARIKWTRQTKNLLEKMEYSVFNKKYIRRSIYRPFTKKYVYFDSFWNEEQYQNPIIFPTSESENENLIIGVVNEAQIPFSAQMTNLIPCLHYGGRQTQCFPFYVYNEDGTNREENITNWALEQFQEQYEDVSITKWDIFYYIYALLHHPAYRENYAKNLIRELPRIPFVNGFWDFAKAGKKLAEVHVNYEKALEFPLKHIENPDSPLDWRVKKMRLSKDKTQLKYNEFLTLDGIPPEVFEYKLGNRSALDWIIAQYQVKIDKRSGIVDDPNNLDDEQYIVRLVGQVISVSLETVEIVKNLPELKLE